MVYVYYNTIYSSRFLVGLWLGVSEAFNVGFIEDFWGVGEFSDSGAAGGL